MIRIYLADDHPVVLEGIARFLQNEPDLDVVGTANVAFDIVESVQRANADVLVLDLRMPGVDGLRTVEGLAKAGVRTLVFSLYSETGLGEELVAAGAKAAIPKSSDLVELATAIRRVARGETLRIESDAPPPTLRFSQRERQIFERIVRGQPLKVIAIELGLSSSTVHTYAHRIRAKLGVETISDIVRYATRLGLDVGLS